MSSSRNSLAIRGTVVAACVTLLASSPLLAECSTADKAALETFDKTWGTASDHGDRAALSAMLADGYMSTSAIGTTDKATTINNTVKAADQAKVNPTAASTPDHYIISCTPLSATITHRSTSTDASGATTYGRSIHFLEKHGSVWQVVGSMGHAVNDQLQLVYLEQDWNDATKRQDAAWVEKTYAPFASDVSSMSGGIESKSQAVASSRASKLVYDALDLSELNVRVEGTTGVVTGVNHVRGKDGQGKAFDRKVRFTDVFIKRDGQWQVWATQGTDIR
jgi:ketosteroid isomerase-like protein